MAIELLNPNVGLGGVIPTSNDNHLPNAVQIAPQDTTEIKLDELYQGDGFKAQIEQSFMPKIETDEILQPATMNRNLSNLTEVLANIKDADVRAFLREDLRPLLDNRDLLRAYCGMMISG